MPSIKTTFVSALAAFSGIASAQIGGHCPPLDTVQPNPISGQYTSQQTGTLNGTHIIIPVPLTEARSLIPSQYPILTKQIKQWLPKLGASNYPILLSIEKLHDIYQNGQSQGANADYLRAHVTFPFVDRLNNGHSAFAYTPDIIVSSTATAAQKLLNSQGYNVSAGYFSNCNAYEYQNGTFRLPPNARTIDQAAWINQNQNLGNPNIAYRMKPVGSIPYSINYLYNVTNQPQFSEAGSSCNQFARIYNSKVSTAPYNPVRMYGNATALKGFFLPTKQVIWNNVYAYKLDVAYHATGNVACSSLANVHVNHAPTA